MFRRKQPGAADLWMDVSTLLEWRGGQFTGIPRTMSSLLDVWLDDATLRLSLCCFDPPTGVLREVPRQELRDALARNRAPGPEPEPPAPARPPSALRRAWRRLPEDLRAAAWHLARFLLRALARPARAARPAPAVAAAPCPFARGDVLLVLGGGWDHPAWGDAVAAAKHAHGLRLAVLFHDVIAAHMPQFFPAVMPPRFVPWARRLVGLADVVLANSENTRRDVLAFAAESGVAAPPGEVVRWGDELPPDTCSRRPRGLPDAGPFVLSVGTVEVRKNHWLLYHLWRRLAQRHGERLPSLVLAGGPGWLTADLLQMLRTDPLVHRRILLLPGLTDAELRWLYQHCLFTLYPSHYEGWGLPVAEALAHGKYCVCSASSSLPEIAGDLLDYHDPLDLAGCAKLVERALWEPGWLSRKEERIRREFRVTPWRACAASVLEKLARHLAGPAARPAEGKVA
jgi:glycosyltransferase involved in cell wall biosynthesis